MVVGFIRTYAISAKVVISYPANGEVYSIQYYVIKFVSNLRQDGLFFLGTPVSSTNKIDSHYITEISLKVALNIKTPV